MNILQETLDKLVKKKQLSYNDRYRQYAIEKANLPYGLSPREYEEQVKKLVKKYRI